MKCYESPKIKFEELKLFEKIADKCWGYKYAIFEDPYDSDDNIDISYTMNQGSGCGDGKSCDFYTKIMNYLESKPATKGSYTSRYVQWVDQYHVKSNNLANVHAEGGVNYQPS